MSIPFTFVHYYYLYGLNGILENGTLKWAFNLFTQDGPNWQPKARETKREQQVPSLGTAQLRNDSKKPALFATSWPAALSTSPFFLGRWILNMDGASTYLSDLLFTYVECPRVRSGAGWMLPDKPAVFLTSAKETPPLFPPLSIPRSLRDGRSPAPHPPSAERQLLHKQL
jgi:hypothetical protein